MILKTKTGRHPQISFPSWIIRSYNPTNKLQTADFAVLQSLDETYNLKKKETEKSVINYLDDILEEFDAKEEEEKRKQAKKDFGKLQCEVVSKKGQHFEIHLDSSLKTKDKTKDISVNNNSVQNEVKELSVTKVIVEKSSNNINQNVTPSNVASRKEIKSKQGPKNSSHLITVERSHKELVVEALPTAVKNNSSEGRKRMKNNVTIEVVKTNGNAKDLTAFNEKGDLKDEKLPNTSDKRNDAKIVESNNSRNAINEVKVILDTVVSQSDNTRDLHTYNSTKTPFSNSKVGLKSRPRSADFSLELKKISNQSGNKTELRRQYTEPLEDISEDNNVAIRSQYTASLKKDDSQNTTPSLLKRKLNSFRGNDIISSIRSRFFKYSKENIEKNPDTCDFLPRKPSPVHVSRSMRGFDSFMMY